MISHFARQLRILAVIRVVGHLAMLIAAGLIGFRLISRAQIRPLTIDILDVSRCSLLWNGTSAIEALHRQVATLLNILVLDLAHSVEQVRIDALMILANLTNRLMHWVMGLG